MISNHIRNYVESHHLLHQGNYGGRQRRSTSDVLTHLTSWIKSKWRENKLIGALFVDVQAAFPTVHPHQMVATLENLGVCPSICGLIKDYITNRSTTIAFGEFESEPKPL